MQTKLFTILLLAIGSISFAQINFEKGYFINNNGTKSECFIKNYGWRNTPSEIEYRMDDNISKKKQISEISEFCIIDKVRYIRAEVEIDRSSEKVNYISQDKQPVFQTETLFLKVLVDGTAKLYQYNNDDLQRFFFRVNDSKIEQLVFKSYYIKGKNNSVNITDITQNNAFRQQLWNQVKCEKIQLKEVENVAYKSGDLIKYFEKVNECKGDAASTKPLEKTEKKGLLNLKAALIANNTDSEILSAYGYNDLGLGSKTALGFGVEVEYVLPFNQNKWSVFAELSFNNYKISGNLSDYSHSSYTVDLKYLQLPMGVRHYLFLTNNSKIFINAALVLSNTLKSSSYDRAAYRSSGFEPATGTYFAGGVGFNYKKFSIELRAYTSISTASATFRYQFL